MERSTIRKVNYELLEAFLHANGAFVELLSNQDERDQESYEDSEQRYAMMHQIDDITSQLNRVVETLEQMDKKVDAGIAQELFAHASLAEDVPF